eukprot:TRINITY_DN10270_c0_g1_i1.p1 TRINITY_DN10270_c0_g1~~TRINITY_DN10270_c0_g1_i1.p1  ORF type:complete len:216 (+),score=39.01 TRINITY_DN10270_c0_g1_i1:67-714(+)
MPQITLHYFDLAGGGEPVRLSFYIAGIEFTDRRISFGDWPSCKAEMPLGQVPVLEVDGKMYTQSMGILRYAGALSGLVAKDPLTALQNDEIMYILNDLTSQIGRTIHMPAGEAKMAERSKWLATSFVSMMMLIDGRLSEKTSSDLDISDLMLYARVNWWSSGVLEGIPKECCTPYKNILRRVGLVTNHPKVQEWNKAHPPPPIVNNGVPPTKSDK